VAKTIDKKYIFKCKLADKPVCVVWDVKNGFCADLLEEHGVWHKVTDTPREIRWVVDYPMIIKYGDTRHETKPGDYFTLS
jgi:hypothetical protein